MALPFRSLPLQHWIGSTDVNGMLIDIGGWHVDCYNDRHARSAVEYAKTQGWVTTRTHYAPAFPEGVPAYELTDAGLERIGATYGGSAMISAGKVRRWYRDQVELWTAKYLMPGMA